MPEHVHLLMSEPHRANLSTAVQALKLGFVRRLEGSAISTSHVPTSRKGSEKWGTPLSTSTSSHFWMAWFYDFFIWTEKKRIEKLRYIHRNPVRPAR